MAAYGLYLHFPFCRSRCAYCDFTTTTGREALIPAYVQALLEEADVLTRKAPGRIGIETVFLGGGTPSLVPAREVVRLLRGLRRRFDFGNQVEVTLEANPEGLGEEYLQILRDAGVNRLSLGMQTGQDHLLRVMTRTHTSRDVLRAVNRARRAGFKNLSLDLMIGIPSQDFVSWRASLNLALELKPEHLSLYGMTVEPGTPFARLADRGLIGLPGGDHQADLLEYAGAVLEEKGYSQYEIANWSQPGCASAHNLRYWRMQPYLGLGVGAHGFTGRVRTENTASLDQFLAGFGAEAAGGESFPQTPATVRSRPLDRETLIEETLIMGLRLVEEGVNLTAFREAFGVEPEDVYPREIKEMVKAGLLEYSGEILRLTRRGRLLGNQVFSRLIR